MYEMRNKLRSKCDQAFLAWRPANDLEDTSSVLRIKHGDIRTELFDKNEGITKVTTASKSLLKDYDVSKSQYGLLAEASNWYRENQVQKRRTYLLDKEPVEECVVACESSSTHTELENLKDTVKALNCYVEELQAKLDAAKLLETEARASNAQLAQKLKEKQKINVRIHTELKDLNQSHEQIVELANKMKNELQDKYEMANDQRINVVILRKEAGDYSNKLNLLAYQSTIPLQSLEMEDGTTLLVMQEIEELNCIIEDARTKHVIEVQSLKEKLEDQSNDQLVEVLLERLMFAESEMHSAVARAEQAEALLNASPVAPPMTPPPPPVAPPLPPPPPPPPPPPMFSAPSSIPLRIKSQNTLSPWSKNNNSVDGKKIAAPVKGLNDHIINQIKGACYTLRKPRNNENSNRECSSSKAVSEMLNVRCNLRRTAKNNESPKTAPNLGVQ